LVVWDGALDANQVAQRYAVSGVAGRFIRVQLTGTAPLSLAEVEIFAVPSESVPGADVRHFLVQ
jgi:hypothetical protein